MVVATLSATRERAQSHCHVPSARYSHGKQCVILPVLYLECVEPLGFGVLRRRQAAPAMSGKDVDPSNPFKGAIQAEPEDKLGIRSSNLAHLRTPLISSQREAHTATVHLFQVAAITMQLVHNILTLIAVAAALPWSEQDANQPQLVGSDGALMMSGQCNIGQHYCFSQIIDDLRMSFFFFVPAPHAETLVP